MTEASYIAHMVIAGLAGIGGYRLTEDFHIPKVLGFVFTLGAVILSVVGRS